MQQNSFSPVPLRNRVKVEFEVISPIHIGTREGKLTALEFVVDGGKLHVIDEEKLGRILLQRGLVDPFVQEVKRGPFSMADFLKGKGRMAFSSELPKITAYSIPGGEPRMQDFRPFVRDGAGSIFLPGSSLKGVLRTCVLYDLAKRDGKFREEIVSRVDKSDLRELKGERKSYSEKLLQKEGMQSFRLPGATKGPNQDILRCLTVRDAYPIGELKTQVIRIHFLSKPGDGKFYWSQKKDKSRQELSLWLEAVVNGRFRTEFLWDSALLEEFKKTNAPGSLPAKDLSDIFKALQTMSNDLVNEERRFFKPVRSTAKSVPELREYLKGDAPAPAMGNGGAAAASLSRWYEQDPSGLFRVGFGSGMLSTTIDLVLPMELRQKVRDACGSGARPSDPAPKSRRVWRKNEKEVLPLGWMKWRALD